jgi:CDP-diglyceride synthetase
MELSQNMAGDSKMELFIYVVLVLLAAAVSFIWSWKRLLDFNSYQKPFIEGTIFNFLIMLAGSIWWYFSKQDSNEQMTGIFYLLVAFLVIMVLNGFILAILFSKRKDASS